VVRMRRVGLFLLGARLQSSFRSCWNSSYFGGSCFLSTAVLAISGRDSYRDPFHNVECLQSGDNQRMNPSFDNVFQMFL
jgi:hypothetical protein